jgi:hypothetical protein
MEALIEESVPGLHIETRFEPGSEASTSPDVWEQRYGGQDQ